MRVLFFSLFFFPFLFSCGGGGAALQFKSLSPDDSRRPVFSAKLEKELFVLGGEASLLDILIAADTSPSMYHHLNRLGRSLNDFLSVISNYDWRIGITSTDHGDHNNPLGPQQSWKNFISEPSGRFGSLMPLEGENYILSARVLSPDMEDYDKIFFQSLSHSPARDCRRPPYCHSPLEQPLRALKAAIMKAPLDNSIFFRPEADFISIIITNEEERAEDRSRASKAEDVLAAFQKMFGPLDKKFIAYNILIKDEGCLQSEKARSAAASRAPSIERLAELTGGKNISICSESYSAALQEISRHIKSSLENSFVLKKEPAPGTLRLDFEGPALNWRLEGRRIVFERRGLQRVSVAASYQSLE